jgi:hypothetical protein
LVSEPDSFPNQIYCALPESLDPHIQNTPT